MEQYSINVEIRKKGEEAKNQKDKIPAILYGKGIDNVMLWVDRKIFNKIHHEAGESSLIDIVVETGKKQGTNKVLIHEVQFDLVTDECRHVDFYNVKMDEEIETSVNLKFVGVASATKELGGVFIKNIDEVLVRCLPADLPKQIDVDISSLETFDDYIYVRDLDVSDNVQIVVDKNTVVALVSPPRTEEELEDLDKKVEEDVTKIDGMKEAKDENKEGDEIEEEKKEEE